MLKFNPSKKLINRISLSLKAYSEIMPFIQLDKVDFEAAF
jgi:hypothetical protein